MKHLQFVIYWMFHELNATCKYYPKYCRMFPCSLMIYMKGSETKWANPILNIIGLTHLGSETSMCNPHNLWYGCGTSICVDMILQWSFNIACGLYYIIICNYVLWISGLTIMVYGYSPIVWHGLWFTVIICVFFEDIWVSVC